MKRLLLVLALFSASCFASDITTGNELLQKCTPYLNYMDGTKTDFTLLEKMHIGFCQGYLSGVIEAQIQWMVTEEKATTVEHYCLPKEANNAQILRILMKWLKDNPDKLHLPAVTIIRTALIEAFPCKQ